MDPIIKGEIGSARIKITEADGASLTVATAVFEVFDTAGASVQTEGNATITDNSSVKVILEGLIDTTDAGFIIDSDYEVLFTYTISSDAGTQVKKKRLAFQVGEEAGAAISGNYITEDDIDNWPAGITDEGRLSLINKVEERIEKLAKDCWRVKSFDIKVNGLGRNYLNLGLMPNILTVSAVEISGVALTTTYYTHDKCAVFLDTGSAFSDAELRYLLKSTDSYTLFPRGRANVRVIGTYGWPERLDIDNISGAMEVGGVITGGTSGATATINMVESTYLKISGRSSTNFTNDEEITDAESEETADVNNALGAVNDPPEDIRDACIMLARVAHNDTLYTAYSRGSERTADFSFSTREKPLTGWREIDIILRPYVRRKPMLAVG